MIPAAGKSKRMKVNKYLLNLKDKSLIRSTIDNLLDAELNEIYLVLSENSPIAKEVKDYKIHILMNKLESSEMADSIKIALNAIKAKYNDGILVTPADIPFVKKDTIKELVENFKNHNDNIVIPVYKGRKGHPVIFPARIIYDLFNENTLRDVIKKHEDKIIYYNLSDFGVLIDIDTKGDYEKLLQIISKHKNNINNP
jgi:molybdenum cofactor cytidylyltransferase